MAQTGAAVPPSVSGQGPLHGATLGTVLMFVKDLDRMLRFYRDSLGLTMRHSNDRFAELSPAQGPGISLHASVGSAGNVEEPRVIVEFIVKDVDRAVGELRSRGVEVDPIREEPWGKIAEFRDPEGHIVGLEQPRIRPDHGSRR